MGVDGTRAAAGELEKPWPVPVVCCGTKEAVSESPDKLHVLGLVTFKSHSRFLTTATIRMVFREVRSLVLGYPAHTFLYLNLNRDLLTPEYTLLAQVPSSGCYYVEGLFCGGSWPSVASFPSGWVRLRHW